MRFSTITLVLALIMCWTARSWASPISLTVIGNDYVQNFNTLSGTGTGNNISVIPGWATSANYDADDGSSSGGGVYSYGRSGQIDRALGMLTTTGTQFIGAEFSNDTGMLIDRLDIQYIGEQWRLAANNLTNTLFFEYSLDATSLTTGTWTAVPALDFVSQVGVPANVAGNSINGNLTVNRTYRATSFAVNIASQTFWIRWRDQGVSGDDHGLAVDDFQITPSGEQIVPEPAGIALGGAGLAALAAVVLRRGFRRHRVPRTQGG